MTLVLQTQGVLIPAGHLHAAYLVGIQIGLGQADIVPDLTTSLAVIEPATFSGYPGLLVLGAWTGPVMVGERAVMKGTPVVYRGSGGPVAQNVFTYYALDGAGALQWCERLPGGPYQMGALGTELVVSPVYTYESQKK